MSEYDRDSWEERWSQALREHGDRLAQRPPNAHLTAEIGDLRPGRALDAGCGHGSETLWLAARGWQVTAVDFAATALAYAQSSAEAMGPDIAERSDWVELARARRPLSPSRDSSDDAAVGSQRYATPWPASAPHSALKRFVAKGQKPTRRQSGVPLEPEAGAEPRQIGGDILAAPAPEGGS